MRRYLWLMLALALSMFVGPVAYAQGDGGDRFIFNEAFVLEAGQTLAGRLAVANGSATLQAGSLVQQDVAAFGSALTIAGTVRGNVAAFGGTVRLQETAIIEGDFAAFGATVVREPGAVIRGDSVGAARSPVPPGALPSPPGRSLVGSVVSWQLRTVGWSLFLAVLGIIAALLAPHAVGRVADAAAADPALTFGLGLLTFIVATLGGALLLIACGLGLLVWLGLGAALLLGWIGVGLWCGRRLLATLRVESATALGEVALGVVLITVLSRLPWCIGFLFSVIVGSIGLGAVVVSRFGTQPPDEVSVPAARVSVHEEPGALELPAPLLDTPPEDDLPPR